MTLSTTLGIGIDVSKDKLDIVLRSSVSNKHFVLTNNDSGIQNLIQQLNGYQGKIVMESTGRYHLLAAFLLSQADLNVRVINPLLARKYVTASIRKNKTDKSDAKILAEIAEVEKDLPARFSANKLDLKIRQKMGLIAGLEKQIQAFKAGIGNYCESQTELKLGISPAEKSLAGNVKKLEKTKAKLEQELEQLVTDDPEGDGKQTRLNSLPGFSLYLSSLLANILSISDCTTSKQWIAFVGLDVSARQSGKWQGRGKLSKRGNSYLRKRLFSAAWGAMMHNSNFKAYYDELRKQGRGYKEALIIIARKLLRIAFAVLKQGKPFDENLSFAKN